jgi:O-antigen ligase
MLWLSINTGPWNFYDLGTDLFGSLNAVRAGLPLFVCAIAFLSLASGGRRRVHSWAMAGFWFYGAIMLLACAGSDNWFSQAYWAFAFLATLAAMEKGLRCSDPLQFLTRVNWLSWGITAAALVVMLYLARDVLYDAGVADSAHGFIGRFQFTHGYIISRSTGLSRMAAVPAIISLVFLFSSNIWQRLLSAAVLLGSLYIIWIMQSRGALFSFLGAFLFVLYFGHRKDRGLAIFIATLLIGLAAVSYLSQAGLEDLWQHATRDEGVAGFSTMTGRDVIWQHMLEKWQQSPLFGYGPQADRMFSVNASNAVVYALLTAGAVGAIFFVVAMLASWRALLALIGRVKFLPEPQRRMLQITGGLLVFATLRSIPENNAAVFSVDLLLQYPAMIYLVVLYGRTDRPKSARSVPARINSVEGTAVVEAG